MLDNDNTVRRPPLQLPWHLHRLITKVGDVFYSLMFVFLTAAL
jgi:hypothetical protein